MARSLSPWALLLAVAAPAGAQSFEYSFDGATSSLDLDVDVALDLSGNLRGVFDAAVNPSGTRTILGLFGDNGMNQDVPVTITLDIDTLLGGAIDGTFSALLNRDLGTFEVTGTAATVGAGMTSTADLSVTLNYSTFRTDNPGAAFIGGFPLTLPLGNADVTDVVLTQSAPSVGIAIPSAVGLGSLDVNAAIPVDLSFSIDLGGVLGGGGAPTPVGPLQILLPLNGTVDLADCGTRISSQTSDSFMQSIPSPVPFDLTDVPLPLPTILPPGGTADLLLTASIDNLAVDGTLGATLNAVARAEDRAFTYCESNPNSSGLAGVLSVQGSTSIGAADMVLVGTELPTNSLGYLLMSQEEDLVPGFGGSQGTLCLGGTLYRYSLYVQNSGALGEISFAPDFGNLPQGQQFLASESWNFQYWFRDANPTLTSNVTSAVRVLFCQ